MSNDYAYYEDVNWGLLGLWGDRRGLDVLDVGCGFATTSERIQRLGNRVIGIEQNPGAVAVASTRIEQVIAKDLADIDGVASCLRGSRVDALIFADVLEHVPRPDETLSAYLKWLKPGGSLFVSLPNVGLWSVRLSHLFGRWDYQDTGVLDRTHLRFFTCATARALVEEAELRIARTTINPGLVRPFIPMVKRLVTRDAKASARDPRALLDSAAYRNYLSYVHPLERAVARLWPGAFAFQIIIEASLGHDTKNAFPRAT